jgi:alpha-glucosidase
LFYHGEKTGLPVMRPLVLHYPKDANVRNLNNEYLVGESILVAPVLEQGVTKRMVYLPEGVWYDYWTGERIEGKQYILKDAPLDVCPMYIKAGSIIPTYDVVQYVGEKPYNKLTLLVTPGKASYSHFQDNGEDYAYQNGEYNLYQFCVDEQGCLKTEFKHKGYTPYEEILMCRIGE